VLLWQVLLCAVVGVVAAAAADVVAVVVSVGVVGGGVSKINSIGLSPSVSYIS